MMRKSNTRSGSKKRLFLRSHLPSLVSSILLLGCISFACAQPCITPTYAYLQSKDIDKILQTYNFSRPWQEEKLVPLTNGYGASFGWNWRIQESRQIHILPEIGYLQFASMATHSNRKFRVGFEQMNIGTSFRMHPKSIFKPLQTAGPLGTRWYISVGATYSFTHPFARINGEKVFWEEDLPYREWSSGFNFSFGTGYHTLQVGRCVLTAEISANWFPKLDLPDFSEIVNGHNLTDLKNEAHNAILLKGLLRVTYIRSSSNWWDKPRV